MKKRLVASLLCAAMTVSMVIGCGSQTSSDSQEASSSQEETEESTDLANDAEMGDFEAATVEQVQEFMNDSDENTVLVDARPQEAYSGWALEGAANGGHLKNSLLFSARWLDCEYADAAPREAYLERAMEDQGITEDSEVIVYDYVGDQSAHVAQYFKDQGIENVSVFQANELIDAGTDLESYENYDMFLPTEIVKSICRRQSGQRCSGERRLG